MRIWSMVVIATGSLLLLACDSSGPAGTGRLAFQLAGPSSAAAGAPTFRAGADVLTLTTVEIVARKIRLERADGTCPVEPATTGPAPSSSEGSDDDEDCPNVWLAPRILSPPVGPDAIAVFNVDLPEGVYEELKLQVHKPTGGQADAAAFLAANPGFANISVRVVGTFNGTGFTFTSAITAEVEIELDAPIEVTAGQPAAMTLQIDLASWFAGPGGALLSPLAPSQQVRSQIEQNIRRSFHAFEDEDRDGDPD